MEFYYDKHPNLVGPVMKTTICKIIKKPQINNTISDKISSYFSDLYNDYIVNNKALTILILVFIAFLIYRYYNKSSKPQKTETFDPIEQDKETKKNLLNEIEDYQTKHLIVDNPPSMNPLFSPDSQNQNDIIHYPPDKLPIRLDPNPGAGLAYRRKNYKHPPPFDKMNSIEYDYGNVYTNPSRSYYSGTFNTYTNAQDTPIQNPYNWSNNFNTNTGNFVQYATDQNMKSVEDLQKYQDNQNIMQFGRQYANGTLDPPFAD